jgi:hypothetical protein
MSDILSRKELERLVDNPNCVSYGYELADTALWLAEKGRLAAHGSLGNCDGCCYETENCKPYPCEFAARELLDWWGE